MYEMFPYSVQGRLRHFVFPQEINVTHSQMQLPLCYRYQ